MPSSAWWKWKWLRYKPLENRVYNGNSNWLLTTASKIQYYNTKPSSWDPSSTSNLRLAEKHLTTKLTNVYSFFFVFFFFLQKEHGKWRKFIGTKQNWQTVQKFSLVSFWCFSQSLILSAHKTKRRCHSSSLDECCVFLIILIMKLESKLSLPLSFTNSLTVPPGDTDLVILKGEDKKDKILYSCWFLLPCVTMDSITGKREEMVLGMEQSKSSTDLINDAY